MSTKNTANSMNTDEREAHLLAQLLQADHLPGVFVSALRPSARYRRRGAWSACSGEDAPLRARGTVRIVRKRMALRPSRRSLIQP